MKPLPKFTIFIVFLCDLIFFIQNLVLWLFYIRHIYKKTGGGCLGPKFYKKFPLLPQSPTLSLPPPPSLFPPSHFFLIILQHCFDFLAFPFVWMSSYNFWKFSFTILRILKISTLIWIWGLWIRNQYFFADPDPYFSHKNSGSEPNL